MGFTETDADDIIEALQGWKPPRSDREEQYEGTLYAYLHEKFPEEVFHRQYSLGKTKADLFVKFKGGARVVVEVKRDLFDRNEYHRLIGQTYEYITEWNSEVVIVLCGESDPALVKLTRQAIGFFHEKTSPKVRFIEKKVVANNVAQASTIAAV